MTRLFKLTAPLFALAAMLVLVSTTQADNDDVSLENVNLGTHVHGPELDADDLAGKVIVFEYWGDRCPPCIRAIPHLVELQEEYGNDKLQIVANQVWNASDENVLRAWQNAGGSDDIMVINKGALEGAQVRGVPKSFVFDHEGNLLWHGHPADKKLDETIEAAVANLPAQS